MNFLSRMNSRFWKHRRSDVPGNAIALGPASPSGLNELVERLDRWGNLWSPGKETSDHSSAQELITRRLIGWMEHCFGEHMPTYLYEGDPISLASSIPVLTAFMGRRATRELSRRVLQDL